MLSATSHFRLLGWLLAAFCVASPCSSESLKLSLSLETSELEAGTGVDTRISVENVSDDFLYFEKWSSFGSQRLNLVARRGRCVYSIPFWHGTRSIGDLRFDYIPLGPGDIYETNGPGLNGYLDDTLVLPETGTYSLQAVFTSTGDNVEGLVWPIWRGTVQSASVSLMVREPAAGTVATNLKALRACISNLDRCENFDGLEAYFSAVRIPEVAELARKAVRSSVGFFPHAYPLAILLANQRSIADADLFLELARGPATDEAMRGVFRKLAERLREEPACWNPGTLLSDQ